MTFFSEFGSSAPGGQEDSTQNSGVDGYNDGDDTSVSPGKGGWGELGGIRLQTSASNETTDMFPLSVCLFVTPYQTTLAQIQHIDGHV